MILATRRRGLGGPSRTVQKFYDCVGLRIECRPGDSDPLTGFSQEECAVNGGEFAFTDSGINASPTTTAGRFGVPWGKALTEWNNAKMGKPCGYDPNWTIQEGTGEEGGAPGGVRSRTRGSAQQPNQPLSGRLLFNTLRRECGIPWGANYAALTPEENACLGRVKRDFRRRGYNWESIKCKGASGEGMLECTPVFIPQDERTGDYRRGTVEDVASPDTSDCDARCTGSGGCVSFADCQALFDTGGPQVRVDVTTTSPVINDVVTIPDPTTDPTSPPVGNPGVSPINCNDSYNAGHPCCSDTGRDLPQCHVMGIPTQNPSGITVGSVGFPGTVPGTAYSEPGFDAHGEDGGGFFDSLTEGDQWIDGVPNLATMVIGAAGGLMLLKQLRLMGR
jgi:hypothetical protein